MNEKLDVEILSPARRLTKVKARAVSVPGVLGFMQILFNHAPLVSELDLGDVCVSDIENGEAVHFYIVGGYVHVAENRVTVLADVVEKPEEIDKARAEEAKKRAEDRLEKMEKTTDLDRAMRALRRANGRLTFLDAMQKIGSRNK